MKRPTSMWLAGTRWTIKWVEVLAEDDSGITTDSDRLIKVQVGAEPAEESFLKQVLVHELLHGAAFAVGGGWPKEEEDCVRMLEWPLTSLFEDVRNKPLLRWLMRGAE